MGERAQEFSSLWRDKQLEYTFRRGLMGRYENFPTCTRQALDYSDSLLQTDLDESAKDALMQVYRKLPAYDDVPASLQALADAGFRMFGFSNGVADDVSGLLQHAGIDQYFEGVVSVDTIGTFKPDPWFTGTSSKSPLPMPITVGWYRAMPSTLSVRFRRE